MIKLKSLFRGDVNVNALSIVSFLSFAVSCTLFLFSAKKWYELKSEKEKTLEQVQFFTKNVPLLKEQINAKKERLALEEQETRKKLQFDLNLKSQEGNLADLKNADGVSARRKYFLEHGMTPEQAQFRASRRKEIQQQQLARKKEGASISNSRREANIRRTSQNADVHIRREAEADRKAKEAIAATNRRGATLSDLARAEIALRERKALKEQTEKEIQREAIKRKLDNTPIRRR